MTGGDGLGLGGGLGILAILIIAIMFKDWRWTVSCFYILQTVIFITILIIFDIKKELEYH